MKGAKSLGSPDPVIDYNSVRGGGGGGGGGVYLFGEGSSEHLARAHVSFLQGRKAYYYYCLVCANINRSFCRVCVFDTCTRYEYIIHYLLVAMQQRQHN